MTKSIKMLKFYAKLSLKKNETIFNLACLSKVRTTWLPKNLESWKNMEFNEYKKKLKNLEF